VVNPKPGAAKPNTQVTTALLERERERPNKQATWSQTNKQLSRKQVRNLERGRKQSKELSRKQASNLVANKLATWSQASEQLSRKQLERNLEKGRKQSKVHLVANKLAT
jgi:hypothetical protein